MEPVVSVIIPTYNRASWVGRAVQSALEQPGVEVDVVVVDDGSTDGTREALAGYEGRLTYLAQANQGQATARNCGFTAARGAHVVFLDSDDVLVPGVLAQAVEALAQHPAAGAAYGRAVDVAQDGRVLSEWHTPQQSGYIFETVVRGETLQLGQCVFRREAAAHLAGPFDVTARAGDDFHFFLRFTRRYELVFVPAVFLRRTVHAQMLTRAKRHVQEDLVERRRRFIREAFGAEAPAIERRYLGRRVRAEWYRTSGYQNATYQQPDKARQFMFKSLQQWPFQPRLCMWLAYQSLPGGVRAGLRTLKQRLMRGLKAS